ncbi:uncharacterized protein [Patagioenas fasciata]|uniref:uncharacterized protein isoform X2 n=1 Tax=Patagioenas fasciata TaxID=372321 RepID=UPI003A99CC40
MRGGACDSLRGQSSTAPGEEAGLGQFRRGARAGIPAPGGGWAGAAGAPLGRPMSPPASTPRREAIDFAALIDRFSLAQGRRGTSDRHRKDIWARADGTGPPSPGTDTAGTRAAFLPAAARGHRSRAPAAPRQLRVPRPGRPRHRESAGVLPEQKLEGTSYSQPQPGEAVANPSYVLITNSCGLTYAVLTQALARSENTFHLCFDPCLACCVITRCRLRMMLLCAAGGLVCHSPEKRSGAIGGLDFEFP